MDSDAPTSTPAERPTVLRRVGKLAAAVAVFAGAGFAFAAFTAEQSNSGNAATAANLTISDDVAAATMFDRAQDADVQKMVPGNAAVRCIGISNGGDVPASVTVRGNTPAGSLGAYITMKVERGTFNAAHTDRKSCAAFVPAGSISEGNLSAFPTSGIADGGAPLAAGATRAYRVTWTLQDASAAKGLSVDSYALTWRLTA